MKKRKVEYSIRKFGMSNRLKVKENPNIFRFSMSKTNNLPHWFFCIALKTEACFIGSKKSKKKISHKSTVNIFKNMPTEF